MDKLLTMSEKELTRLEVMQRLDEKRLAQKEGAEMLGVSSRHIRRLLKRYRQAGASGLEKICYNNYDLLLVAPLNQWKIFC